MTTGKQWRRSLQTNLLRVKFLATSTETISMKKYSNWWVGVLFVLVGTALSKPLFATCTPLGPQKILVIQITTPNDNTDPISTERIQSVFKGPSPINLDSFWKEISRDQTFVENLEVRGPYLVNSAARCGQAGYEHQIASEAMKASKMSDEKLASFDRIFVIMPNPGCGFAGYSSVGCQRVALPGGGTGSASLSLLLKPYFEPIAIIHEATHGLGFWHSRTRAFSRKPLGDFEKRGKFTESDPYSLMSSAGRYLGMPGAFQRQGLGLLPQSQIQTIMEASESGVYRVYSRSSNRNDRIVSLKIERKPPANSGVQNSSYLWAEYVTKDGFYDSQIQADTNGLLITYQDRRTGREGHLLNFGKKRDFSSAVLKTKWIDPYSSLRMEVVDIQPDYLDVRVWYGN